MNRYYLNMNINTSKLKLPLLSRKITQIKSGVFVKIVIFA